MAPLNVQQPLSNDLRYLAHSDFAHSDSPHHSFPLDFAHFASPHPSFAHSNVPHSNVPHSNSYNPGASHTPVFPPPSIASSFHRPNQEYGPSISSIQSKSRV